MKEAHDADMRAIEELHERDVAAARLGDFDALESLMDADCVVIPSDEEPQNGIEYLNRFRAARDGLSDEIVELTQDWAEVVLLGGHAYEWGVVRSSVRGPGGRIVSHTQRIMRILRRQPNGTWRVLRAIWQAPKPTPGRQAQSADLEE